MDYFIWISVFNSVGIEAGFYVVLLGTSSFPSKRWASCQFYNLVFSCVGTTNKDFYTIKLFSDVPLNKLDKRER